MDLVNIETRNEDDFLSANLFQHVWIGSTDAASQGTWRWTGTNQVFWSGGTGGGPVGGAYTHREENDPDFGIHGDCAAKDAVGDGSWENFSCNDVHQFVCERVVHVRPVLECVRKYKFPNGPDVTSAAFSSTAAPVFGAQVDNGHFCFSANATASPDICFDWNAQYVDSGPWPGGVTSEDLLLGKGVQVVPASFARYQLEMTNDIGVLFDRGGVLDANGCIPGPKLPEREHRALGTNLQVNGVAHTSGRREKPNRWGLFDVLGNVWEWTSDKATFSDPPGPLTAPTTDIAVSGTPQNDARVTKGGAASLGPSSARAAGRDYPPSTSAASGVGFGWRGPFDSLTDRTASTRNGCRWRAGNPS